MTDLAQIQVKAGNGGTGAVSFRREKFIPKGGPDGGDGGIGGNVYARGDHNLATLLDFRSRKNYSAPNGRPGQGKKMKGEDGDDIEILLPIGTLIYEINTQEKEVLIHDIANDSDRLMLAQGGKGGVGNWRFRSSTNQAPRQYTKGEKGEVKTIKLELKLVADVGLVGMPNAGKSTLINILTQAQAKVGAYPFTTIHPNLGVLALKNGKKAVLSDIPGLIEGASEGKGLGDEFLRHVERTRILVHLVDPYEQKDDSTMAQSALQRYKIIQNELKDYKVDLTKKPQIVVISKMDVTEVAESFEEIKAVFKKEYGVDVFGISAVTGIGLNELTIKITQVLDEIPKKPMFEREDPVKIYTIENLPNKRIIYGKQEVFELE